ncbi:MAG: aquaporin [Planctomycetaceae bacterium]|nr:aquaporin [Planctomycetaceae bacterium]
MFGKYFAEFLGTFMLLFAGTGAIVVNHAFGGVVTHVGVALTFGLVVLAIVYALGDVSGAHINPAVTLAFWVAGRFDFKHVVPFIAAQLLGAGVASLSLRLLFPDDVTLGATLPNIGVWQSVVLEIILTWFLMFVVLNVSTGAKEKGIMAGVAVGSVVALEAMFAGPACGASMNPARSFGPAIGAALFPVNAVSVQPLYALWIYFVGPIIGAFLAVASFYLVRTGADSDET